MMESNKNLLARRQQLKAVTSYLENGRYFFSADGRVLFKADQANTLAFMERNLTAANDDLPELVIETEQKSSPLGYAVWFGINGDLKLFTPDKVLTFSAGLDSFQRKLANYHYFSCYFTLPEVLYHNAAERVIIEERVFSQPISNPDKELLQRLIGRDYLDYFRKLVKAADQLEWQSGESRLAESSNNAYQAEFADLLTLASPLLTTPFPRIRVHGDLWTENILLTAGQKVVYLDWDESENLFFFFDIFKFLWNELDVHNERSYYESYLRGEFDELLSEWFTCFGLSFLPRYRKEYLYLFFLDFLLAESTTYPYQAKRQELRDFKKKILEQDKE
ncbi:hypothetical protein RU97_GL002261 [Enterococcus canis]|uniref:Aminoglycoside phosphotransferase domain-containing protein n=2 Tax=Enterococcus canis TaxID=214095 RepID=A0A1L8REK3_9ENTE|nr:phosphotransferase [Enterococcus canis]OJG18188.1 hypothetical protein RU97_GL002261 [Enterococcus canis]